MINPLSRGNKVGNLVLPSIIVSLVLIVCALIIRSTIIKVKGFGQTISVTGAAFKPIISDYAIWEGEISVALQDLETGYARLKSDIEAVKDFLHKKGFTADDYDIKAVQIQKQFDRECRQIGIILSQRIRLEMDDVNKIEQLSLEASTLIEKGIEFRSLPPRYLFTKLDDLKLEMIKAATENAKLRAEQLAEATDKNIGAPTSARVGVFQIRSLHSQEVSGYGISDVTSIEKEIVCTVHISFRIE